MEGFLAAFVSGHGLILKNMTGVMHLSNVHMKNAELHSYIAINLSYDN